MTPAEPQHPEHPVEPAPEESESSEASDPTTSGEDTTTSASDGATSTDKPAGHKQKHKLKLWQESVLLLVVALAVAIVMKSFFVQAFFIPSASMEPGLVEGDRILVQKVSYWGSGTPQRGDVVVFKDPGDWLNMPEEPTNLLGKVFTKIGLQPSGGHLVKRVIGVAGDTIVCCDEKGQLSINGHPMDESSYVKNDPAAPCNGPMDPNSCNWKVGPIPAGQVFVMGDNRYNSADSTVHMCRNGDTSCVDGDEYVPTDLVVGKVFSLVWPAKRFEWVTRPDVFADVPDPKK